jgi:eukaryotic-like serine/threonine-protein kinase
MRTRDTREDDTPRTARGGGPRGGEDRSAGPRGGSRAGDRLWAETARTSRLGGSDPTEQLPGAGGGARSVLGRYRLERRLGAGGFGVVWLAWDERLEREVAVKVIPREGGHDRVEREARAAARLNHPGIVGLYELASDEHDVYLVSELVRGRTLADLERERAISDRDVARIGVALCAALDHAHARGVIHRDVKPQNVIVVAEPAAGAGFAKLADFGVAHVTSGDPITRTGDVVGTIAYMAPEQAEGSRVTPACDVYSLALTLYEAWTGTNPVRAGGPAATARRLGRPLPSLAAMRRDLPLELCDAIDAALDPDPLRRPPPAELARELQAVEEELDDKGGLVEPETLARVGLTTRGRRTFPWSRGVRGERAEGGRVGILPRLAAGAGAGLLLLLALTQLGPEPPFSPLAAAAGAAAATALLPRIGWICALLVAAGWLASPDADRQGTALVLLVVAAPVPLLLPRAGVLWSLPALAPLLGLVALGPAFVGVAAVAGGTAARRAGLAAAGLVWLAVAEVATREDLLFGVPDGALARSEWQESATRAASDALEPLLASPALLPAIAWAAFAVVLPLVVRGRFLGLDAVAAAVWATGLILALMALGDVLTGWTALDQPRGAVAGSAAAALVAVAVRALAAPEASRPDGWRGAPAPTP